MKTRKTKKSRNEEDNDHFLLYLKRVKDNASKLAQAQRLLFVKGIKQNNEKEENVSR